MGEDSSVISPSEGDAGGNEMILSHRRFNDAILDGTKDTTVRLNNRFYPGEIHAMMNPDSGFPFAWVRIISVSLIRLGNVDARREGFAHVDDLVHFLSDSYERSVFIQEEFYLITFERVEAPDEPKVTPDA